MKRRSFLLTTSALGLAMTAPALSSEGPLKLRDLYEKDLSFSAYARDHEDQTVVIQGFMAPPLKAESRFFVLTKKPMSVCPFCETEAEWPDDIVVVYTEDVVDVVPFNRPIAVTGTLSLGTYKDEETQFVSRVRLVDADYTRI